MNRAYSMLTVKAVEEDQRIIRGTATTPEADRIGDIVEPLGVTFKNPMPLLHQHDSEKPVGTVKFDKPTKDGITFEARLPNIDQPGPLKDRVDTAWGEIKAGLIRAVSIGFRAIEYSFMETGVRYSATEVLELSLVSVPANAGAVISQIKSIDAPLLAATGKEPKASDRPVPPGVTGKSQPVKLTPKEGKKVKTFQEQIAEWEAKRSAKAARQTEIMTKAAETGQTLDTAEGEEHDAIGEEIAQIDTHLKRLGEMQKQMVQRAVPVAGATLEEGSQHRADARVQVLEPKLDKGIGFARLAQAMYISSKTFRPVDEIAKEMWPNWGMLHQKNVAAGTTTGTNWALPLVNYTILANEFAEFLRPLTIIGQFGQNGIPSLRRVPFNVKLGRQTTKGTGYWVGEGAAKPVTEWQMESITLAYMKAAAIAVITEELLRFSSPSAEMIVRDELAAAVVEAIDIAFIDPANAGTSNVKPAAITYGASTVASSGDTLAAIVTDVLALTAPMTQANLRSRNLVWIMNENVARGLSLMYTANGVLQFPTITPQGGTFQGNPVIVSQYVPSAVVALVAADEIMLADDGNVTLDFSREASLEMVTSSSQTAATGTGASLVSMFQTNSVAFRAEREIAWRLRRAAAVAYLTSANWGGTPGSGDI